jgi:holo-[acyl-carrier protein] synthase
VVVGLGIDVASVERIRRSLERFGDRFWERILTPAEREDLEGRGAGRAIALAGRFAAKEAFSKAIGAPNDVWWHDVEIRRGAGGAPELRWTGPANHHMERLKVARALISITHDAGVAAAVVILDSGAT